MYSRVSLAFVTKLLEILGKPKKSLEASVDNKKTKDVYKTANE